MSSPLLVEHHVRSLEDLEQRLNAALSRLFPVSASEGQIEFESCRLGSGVWKHTWDRPTWVRPLRVQLDTATGPVSAVVADLPWPVGADAREELEAICMGGAPGQLGRVRLGNHTGLFIGRPMVSLGLWLSKPGIHSVSRPRGDRDVTRVLIVPDAGRRVYLQSVPTAGHVTVTGLGRTSRVDVEELKRRSESGASSNGIGVVGRRLQALFEEPDQSSRRMWFSSDTASRIEKDTGIPLEAGSLTETHLQWIVGQLCAERAPHRRETSAEVLGFRLLGDVYLDIVWRAMSAASRGTPKGAGGGTQIPSLLLMGVRRRTDREIRTVLSGRGDQSPLAMGEDATNSLARMESHRKVTMFGPDGSVRPQRGLHHLRDLSPDFRGILCPLSTPESADIGLVRFLASGAELDGDGRIVSKAEPRSSSDLGIAPSLVPYINHNDPVRASIGSRILRQAVTLDHPEVPLVRTGAESDIAESAGVCRALVAGRITSAREEVLEVVDSRNRRSVYPFGVAGLGKQPVGKRWHTVVAVGDRVSKGQILAHAPDVAVHDDIAEIALGLNCVVAYMPWHGFNYEDAIVVSESLAKRFTSFEEVVVKEQLSEADVVLRVTGEGRAVEAGVSLAEIMRADHVREVVSPIEGEVVETHETANALEIRMVVRRPLAVGDKLTNRHGAKGVVSVVVPDTEMPHMADGTVIEIVVNPLGVLRRLNIGQFLETHVGLLSMLTKESPGVAGRTLGDLEELRTQLLEAGAPNGLVTLTIPASERTRSQAVVVGSQYFVKLDHMAADKAQVRSSGRSSVRSHQPQPGSRWTGGLKTGGPQRVGEMEMWCLQAIGAEANLYDVLGARSGGNRGESSGDAGATLLAVDAHLMAAGLLTVFEYEDGSRVDGQSSGLENLDVSRIRRQWTEFADVAALSEMDLSSPSVDVRADEHPLYDAAHGGFDGVASCPCGFETRATTFCKQCREMAVARPLRERSKVRFGIPLSAPVPHPWFTMREESVEENGRVVVTRMSPEIHVLPILPPAYRVFGRDPLDRRYAWVATLSGRLADARDQAVGVAHATAALEKAVEDVLGSPGDDPDRQTIAARLNGKMGLLRRHLLGRTTDMSARGVIIPDPDMDPEGVGLPRWMYEELIRVGVDAAPAEHDDVCFLNRQPSLHPYNLVALRAHPVNGDAIRIHPLLCGPIAGDFDGDTVAIHRPSTDRSREEFWRLSRPSHQFRSAASGELLASMNFDIALGLYLATATAEDRRDLARRLGVATPDAPLCGRELNDFAIRYAELGSSERERLERLCELVAIGFEAASGWSVSLLDLKPLAPDIAESMDGPMLTAEISKRVDANASLSQAVRAGVAGKPEVLVQLLGNRQPTAGFDTRLLSSGTPAGNLLVGLSDERYFACINGAMKTLADKKLTTPIAGALTKALVEAAYDVAISEEDCGNDSPRSPLSCRNPDPCAACYGRDPSTGGPPVVGARVGVLAAQLIGERSTQLAMKAFHGGGTGVAVGGRVSQLGGLFGQGRFEDGDGNWVHLADVFESGSGIEAVGPPLLEVFTRLIDGEVLAVHASVILRRLWEVWAAAPSTSILADAAITGSALVDATTRGSLGVLMRDVGTRERTSVESAKLRLVVGGGEPG